MQPKTDIQPNLSPEVQNEQDSALHSRMVMLREQVARSKEYGALRQQQFEPADAYSKAIEAIVADPNNGLSERDITLLSTIGHLGTFVEAQSRLYTLEDSHSQGEYIPQTTWEEMKRLKNMFVIPFNHELKSLINEIPNATVDGLTHTLSEAYVSIFSRYDAISSSIAKEQLISRSDSMYLIKKAIDGMRNETAAETLLTAAGIEYDYEISVKDDAEGTDLVVYIDGKIEKIDIKSSRKGQARALRKFSRSRAVWTGLTPSDFRGINGRTINALSIPFSVAEERADTFVDNIREMIQRNARTDRVGRQLAQRTRY